jgi:hypothetical protein
MVKHGKDKKRRAGRTGKTKLKNKNFNRWDPNPKVSDATMKKHWDPSKSPAENLKFMGLLAHPNDIHAASKLSLSSAGKVSVALFDIPESDQLDKPKRCPLSAEDQSYIARCMTRYGDDYVKMFRDTKTFNKMQYTESQLQKMGARFLLLTPEERTVDLPKNMEHLAVGASS